MAQLKTPPRPTTVERVGILSGKNLVITGVLTDASLAFGVAQLAQQEGAKIVLTGAGRGLSITQRAAKKLSTQVEKEARDYFNEKVYSTVIPRNVRLSEAPSHGMPVLIYDKSCPGSKSYFSFTDEFIIQETTIGSAA